MSNCCPAAKRYVSAVERLALAFEAIGSLGWCGWCDWDVVTDKLYGSEHFVRMDGVSPEAAARGEPIGTYMLGIHADDRDRVGADDEPILRMDVVSMPEVLVRELAASMVNLRIRWWSSSARADVVAIQSEVLLALKFALDEADIDMPYDTQVLLLHDQTDETNGHRDRQREGWPAPKNGDVPRSAQLVREKRSA